MKLKFDNDVLEFDLFNEKLQLDTEENNFKILYQSENYTKVEIKGEVQEVYFARNKDDIFVNVEGKNYVFKEIEESADFSSSNQNLDKAEIMPPMPGSIIQIVVAVGDEVKEGDPLIIVEAMKMETTLYSPISGKVTDIKVSEKEQVSGDEPLMIVGK